MEEQLIIDIWDTFKEYIPEKSRETAASHYVDFLLGTDVETSTLESLMGYDQNLDQAIELILDNEKEESEDEDEENWGYEDDDKDY